MKKILALLLVAVMALTVLVACGDKKVDVNAKSEGSMTYAQFDAAALDTKVVIEGYVQSVAYAQAYGNASLFLADGDGAYYVYRIACDDALAAKLTVGAKVKVTGYKAAWAGEVEINCDGDTEAKIEVLEGNYVAPAKDVTALLGTDDLIKNINALVAVKGLKVEAANEAGDAFLYNWDGSGSEGSDLYFNVSLNGTTYQFTVESSECGADTDVYKAVKALKVGDTIDVEGFLYWYNGAQPHVTKVVVK